MRTPSKVIGASAGLALILAACGSTAQKAGTSGSTAPNPPATTTPAPSTTLAGVVSQTEATDLRLVHEQLRAGHDAYSQLAARYDLPIFTNLTSSEATQLATASAMMARLGVTDPSSGLQAGHYSDPTVQALYDTAVGAASTDDAFDAVEHMEEHNLTILGQAKAHTTRGDLLTMYANMEKSSTSHIDACNEAHPGS